MGLLNRLAPRRADIEPLPGPPAPAPVDDSVFATKALRKLLSALMISESPVLIDLGPVVGSNVSFFGEQVGCKIFVEDLFADVDRHARSGSLDALPQFFAKRLPQQSGTVDGILCWDLFDYLDKPSAQVLANELTRVLRPDGALLAFFSNAPSSVTQYTKYTIVDENTLKHRPYPAACARQAARANGEIIKLFSGLRVAESFLLLNKLRELLFRKPV